MLGGDGGDESEVGLEDVFPLVAGPGMGTPLHHSAHIFQGRLTYVLAFQPAQLATSTALTVRDETLGLLRTAADL